MYMEQYLFAFLYLQISVLTNIYNYVTILQSIYRKVPVCPPQIPHSAPPIVCSFSDSQYLVTSDLFSAPTAFFF